MFPPKEERRKTQRVTLNADQLEQLADLAAERAAQRVLENFYREVGKVTIRSCVYIAGAAILSALAWLGVTGRLK